MNRTAEEAICAYVKAKVEFLPPFTTLPEGRVMSFYTTGEKEKFKLPCVSFEMIESEPLHAGTRVSRGTMTVWVETQADDESEEIHQARVAVVENELRKKQFVIEAVNMAGKIKLFGFAVGASSAELKDRHWTSGIDLTLGFGPLPPQF